MDQIRPLSPLAILLLCAAVIGLFYYMWKKTTRYRYRLFPELYRTPPTSPFQILAKLNYHRDQLDPKIISTSLYGRYDDDGSGKYNVGSVYADGAIENAKRVRRHYPDWYFRVYVHYRVPKEVIETLLENDAEVCIVYEEPFGPCNGMFWRFLPLGEKCTFICRDVDETLCDADYKITQHWLKNTDKKFMRLVIAPLWGTKHISGGCWGSRGALIPNIAELINNYPARHHFGSDEIFLKKVIYPLLDKDQMITYVSKTLNIPWKLRQNFLGTDGEQQVIHHLSQNNTRCKYIG